MAEDEMVGWHHRLNGHEFESAPGVGDGQGDLLCCAHRVAKSCKRLSDLSSLKVCISTCHTVDLILCFPPFDIKIFCF